jgi:hypothetical protein
MARVVAALEDPQIAGPTKMMLIILMVHTKDDR